MLGMPLNEAIALRDEPCRARASRRSRISARCAPARRPTSRCSSCATASFEFVDNIDGKRTGRQKLVAAAVVMNGKRVA